MRHSVPSLHWDGTEVCNRCCTTPKHYYAMCQTACNSHIWN